MARIITFLFCALILRGSLLTALEASPEASIRATIVGEAILRNEGYQLLKTMTTRHGPRMAGTEGNRRSLDLLEEELHRLGIETRREAFSLPGWKRGNDSVSLVSEPARPLRAAALGYVSPHEAFEAGLAVVESLDFEEINPESLRGRIVLMAPNLRPAMDELERFADEFGVVGVLLINRKNGGQLLARVSGHEGNPPPFPVYSITVEEGRWMQRQMEAGMPVRIRMETESGPGPMTVENLVAVLPGRSDEVIVAGAHFDSWDLGQGAVDNGLGIAQLFDLLRILKAHSPVNEHTVEVVFFNAEEWGLWGSRDYAGRHDLSRVRTMLNLDMVGEPLAVNAMGFDGQVPFLKAFAESLGAWNINPEVDNKPWLGSDHHPFILRGVPAITFNAPIDPDVVRYYHDFGDTFEKVDPAMLARSTALVALLVYDLANDTAAAPGHLDEAETAELFRKAGLEKRMRKAGQWPFDDEPAK